MESHARGANRLLGLLSSFSRRSARAVETLPYIPHCLGSHAHVNTVQIWMR